MQPKAQNVSLSNAVGRAGRSFSGSNALQVAMPLGGIGAGCVCLNGIGALQDFSIRHHPETSAVPDGHGFTDAAFAILRIEGSKSVTKLLEGQLPPERVYDQGLQTQGYRKGGYEGLPRFRNAVFRGEYPFGEVALRDPRIPLDARITGWNPFIPLDDKNSGIPCAILEYSFKNTSKKRVDFEFSYHLSHLAYGKNGEAGTRNTVIPGRGVFFTNDDKPNGEKFGSASVTLAPLAQPPGSTGGLASARAHALAETPTPASQPAAPNVRAKGMWLRSGWFDTMTALWEEVSNGSLIPNEGSNGVDTHGRNGGSLAVTGSLKPGESVTYPILITWYFPNCFQRVGGAPEPACCPPGTTCCPPTDDPPPAWRPYYAGQWSDARDVADYVAQHFTSLRGRTLAFKNALFASTLPAEAIDAISANLAIMKSPTVLRQENGNVWGWEGCFTGHGCCHGSCTHVWNYAQAFPHLFPKLERTLREQELARSMNDEGYVKFRAALPDGPVAKDFHAAADGQLGGIMKVYRDWQISGDMAWLKKMYPLAKRSLDYCIQTWDPEQKGALFEPHHNTFDIEFWGPDGMCTSIYIGALSAQAEMAAALDQSEDECHYAALAERGSRYMERQLFNGEYFEQKVMYKNLRDQSFVKSMQSVNAQSGVVARVLKREGPKYQYGKGCLSDGVIGAWMAKIYGIETPLSRERVRRNLKSIFLHNFRGNLINHACTQRPGYATGAEGGLLVCSWPHGGKPTLPFVYCDEVWTGVEYQVASHLIAEGFVAEGLSIVKAARGRYDGRARNPWNEYECGGYYVRAMSSYALLGALSGFRYSAVEKKLWFGPPAGKLPFKSFFSAASGFGVITLDRAGLSIEMIEGELAIERVCLNGGADIEWDVAAKVGQRATLALSRTLKRK